MFHFIIIAAGVAAALWSISNPSSGGWAFVIGISALEGWLLILEFTQRPSHLKIYEAPHFLTADEVTVITSYPLFFKFPLVSIQLSAALVIIQKSVIFWLPWLLYQGQWVQAVLIGLNLLVVGPLALRLHPQPFLHHALSSPGRRNMAEEQLKVLVPLVEKLYSTKGR
jgi:hypothetical protein